MIANGDVFCRADFARVKEATGCDSCMMARGALHRPSAFREGGPIPLDEEIVEYLKTAVSVDSHHKNQKYVVERMLKAANRTNNQYDHPSWLGQHDSGVVDTQNFKQQSGRRIPRNFVRCLA